MKVNINENKELIITLANQSEVAMILMASLIMITGGDSRSAHIALTCIERLPDKQYAEMIETLPIAPIEEPLKELINAIGLVIRNKTVEAMPKGEIMEKELAKPKDPVQSLKDLIMGAPKRQSFGM